MTRARVHPLLLGACMTALTAAAAPRAHACGDPEELLAALLAEHDRLRAAGASPEVLTDLEARLDAVAGAKDAAFSGLYWHRDLGEARVVAAERGQPILSLRLLGELTCDRSCANSRFFRTALYANEALAAWLRDNVVLHWESVRPVPTITIDFGDGRKLERTITGNSIHYLLLPDGTVVDAFPGLYGPQAFADAVAPAAAVARRALSAPPAERRELLTGYWEAVRGRLAFEAARGEAVLGAGAPEARDGMPTARDAAPMAMGKAVVEAPMLDALDGEGASPTAAEARWEVRAGFYRERCRLDARSRRLMARKVAPEQREPAAFAALVAAFEEQMARDTAQNELRLRPVILAWLLDGAAHDLAALNARVYDELFLTPDADPWLGLAPADAYAALEGGGLRAEAPSR